MPRPARDPTDQAFGQRDGIQQGKKALGVFICAFACLGFPGMVLQVDEVQLLISQVLIFHSQSQLGLVL